MLPLHCTAHGIYINLCKEQRGRLYKLKHHHNIGEVQLFFFFKDATIFLTICKMCVGPLWKNTAKLTRRLRIKVGASGGC